MASHRAQVSRLWCLFAGNQGSADTQDICHCGGARLGGAGLTVRLHLLPVWQATGLKSHAFCASLQVIRDLLTPKTYVIVVEHDLAVLDYLSDFICCLYGKPGAYGVVTMPFSVREGINIFLSGFVPTENLRFREEALTFKVSQPFS